MNWLDIAAFIAHGCVCFDNSGRDILVGAGFVDQHGIARDFLLAEHFRVQFRA